MIYLIIIIILIPLIYHYDYRNHIRNRNLWFNFILLILILVSGLRYRLGVDTLNYVEHYKYSPDLSNFFSTDFSQTRFGIGYLILSSICKSITNDFTLLQLIISTFVNTSILRFFYKNTPRVFSAILLYFCICYLYYNMEIIREAIAISMFLISWRYFVEHLWIKYYLCVLIAFLFHPSSLILVFLPLGFLPVFNRLFNLNWTTPVWIIIFYGVGIFLSIRFFDLLRLINLSQADTYADMYEMSDQSNSINLNILGIISFTTISILYPLVATWCINSGKVRNKFFSDPKYASALYVIIFWSIYFAVFSQSIFILTRFSNYFTPFIVLVISDVLFDRILLSKLNLKLKLSFPLWAILIFPYFLFSMANLFSQYHDTSYRTIQKYYPYSSVLTKEIDADREKMIGP